MKNKNGEPSLGLQVRGEIIDRIIIEVLKEGLKKAVSSRKLMEKSRVKEQIKNMYNKKKSVGFWCLKYKWEQMNLLGKSKELLYYFKKLSEM